MLRAAAIFYALVMALVIAIISGSLLMYSYFSTIHLESCRAQERKLDDVNSGITFLLSAQESIMLNEKKTLDLFGNGKDSVELFRKSWGAFEIIYSSAKNSVFSKCAMVGCNCASDSDLAFYLADRDAPLTLCGKTSLKGVCYLPRAGIKQGYIEGESFHGDLPAAGQLRESKKTLPEINKNIFESIEKKLAGDAFDQDSIVDMSANGLPDSLDNSFSVKTLVLKFSNDIVVDHVFLKGNICIWSPTEVKVMSGASLNDIVIYAKKVKLDDGFEGSLQLFASDSILVGKKCRFSYPTVIGALRSESSGGSASVNIQDESEISGIVFTYQDNYDPEKITRIKTAKDVLIKGSLFTNGCLDFTGEVYGSVICAQLLLSTSSALYENHLMDAVIDRERLSPYFTGIDIWAGSRQKRIVKWL